MDLTYEEVERLAVQIGESSRADRLYPTLRDGDLALEIDPPAEEYPFGANVASALVFDLDHHRRLCSVEVLAPERVWQLVGRLDGLPEEVDLGTLTLLGSTTEVVLERPNPTFEYLASGDVLVIAIEPRTARSRWVGLSESCFAYVNDGFLGGFVVDLDDARRRDLDV